MVWDFCLHILTYNKVDSGLHSRLQTGPWTGKWTGLCKVWFYLMPLVPITCGLQSYRKHLPCTTLWEINNRCTPVRIIGSKLCSLQLISILSPVLLVSSTEYNRFHFTSFTSSLCVIHWWCGISAYTSWHTDYGLHSRLQTEPWTGEWTWLCKVGCSLMPLA